MTREETVKFIYDILKKHSVKVNEVDVIPVSSCIALVDDLINHENDLLKEFVGWQAKQYKDLYYMYEEEIKNEKDYEDYLWLCGRKAGIGEVRKRLNQDLKNFLKERK